MEFEKCGKSAEFELPLLGVNSNLCNHALLEQSQHCQAVRDILGCCRILLSDSSGRI